MRLWNEKRNGHPPVKWLTSPRWMNQAMDIITAARNDVEEKNAERAKMFGSANLRFLP